MLQEILIGWQTKMGSQETSIENKLDEVIMNDLVFDQIKELLECIHNHKDVEHILEARNVLWTAKKDLSDIVNDQKEMRSKQDFRTLTDIEQTLTYMIDHELCYGDEYTAEVLKDLKEKYW